MAVSLISAVFRQDLPPTQKLVLLALADSSNDDDGGCWFLMKTLCAKTGCSERSLRYQFEALESAGYLRRERRFGRSSLFWLCLSKLGVGGAADPARVAGSGSGDPAKVAAHPAKVAAHPAKVAAHPATVAPISVSYPGSDPLPNPPEAGGRKNALPGARSPGADAPGGRFGEGGAAAPGTGSPGPSARSGRSGLVHISVESEPEVSEAQRAVNRARLHALALSFKGIPG